MLSKDECRRLAAELLQSWQARHTLVITGAQEFAVGWVFFYNTEEFVRTGDIVHALGGNAPILVDRRDGTVHVTGSTACPTEHWIEAYLRDHPAPPDARWESTTRTRGALGAEDYVSIDRAGRVLHERGWRKAFSLNEMLDAWREFIDDVEEGYTWGIDEYWNDSGCRAWLDEAWPLLTAAVREARQAELDALDDRFRAVTEPVHQWAATRKWWQARIPIRRDGELAEDIARLLRS